MNRWILAAAIGVALGGCAKKDEVTISTPDGNVKVSGDGNGGNVTIESPDGKIEVDGKGDGSMTVTNEKGEKVTVGAASSADLSRHGIQPYPGAEPQAGQAGMGKVEGPEGTMETVVMTTSDAVEKVLEFYKGQMKEPKAITSPDGGMVSGKTKDGHDVTAIASKGQDSKETTITISVITKK